MTESPAHGLRKAWTAAVPLRPPAPLAVAVLLLGALACSCAGPASLIGERAARERAKLAVPSPDYSRYMLHPGDVISVKFFYTPELNEHQAIRPDGMISLQLIGDVLAANLTPPQLRDTLLARYEGIILKKELTVIVNSASSIHVYVGGEVNHPGIISTGPGMTPLQAVIAAGGERHTAELRNVVIIRDQGTPQPLLMLVDLTGQLASVAGYQSVALHPKDIVYVPKTRIAKLNQWMDQYVRSLLPISTIMNVNYNFGTVTTR